MSTSTETILAQNFTNETVFSVVLKRFLAQIVPVFNSSPGTACFKLKHVLYIDFVYENDMLVQILRGARIK